MCLLHHKATSTYLQHTCRAKDTYKELLRFFPTLNIAIFGNVIEIKHKQALRESNQSIISEVVAASSYHSSAAAVICYQSLTENIQDITLSSGEGRIKNCFQSAR